MYPVRLFETLLSSSISFKSLLGLKWKKNQTAISFQWLQTNVSVDHVDTYSPIRFTLFLHLYEIVEGLYFHYSLSVCLSVYQCVCVSVCPALLVNKIPAKRMNRFGCGFAKWLLTSVAQTYQNWWPLVKSQGHSDVIPSSLNSDKWMMNKLETYIFPDIRLSINQIFRSFRNICRFTSNDLPTWLEQSSSSGC